MTAIKYDNVTVNLDNVQEVTKDVRSATTSTGVVNTYVVTFQYSVSVSSTGTKVYNSRVFTFKTENEQTSFLTQVNALIAPREIVVEK